MEDGASEGILQDRRKTESETEQQEGRVQRVQMTMPETVETLMTDFT